SVAVPDIEVSALKLAAEDRQVKPAASLRLDPLNLQVHGFSTAADAALDIALESGVNASGKLKAQAHVTPRSGALQGQIEAADLALEALQPYIARYTSMTLLKGALGARFDIERDAAGTLAIKGKTGVANLATVDNALRQDFVKWKELLIGDISYR